MDRILLSGFKCANGSKYKQARLLRVGQPKGADGLSSMVDVNHMRERGVPMTHTSATLGSSALLTFRIRPIAGLKNCRTRLQEGKVITMGN
jgi:hypothetical protein